MEPNPPTPGTAADGSSDSHAEDTSAVTDSTDDTITRKTNTTDNTASPTANSHDTKAQTHAARDRDRAPATSPEKNLSSTENAAAKAKAPVGGNTSSANDAATACRDGRRAGTPPGRAPNNAGPATVDFDTSTKPGGTLGSSKYSDTGTTVRTAPRSSRQLTTAGTQHTRHSAHQAGTADRTAHTYAPVRSPSGYAAG